MSSLRCEETEDVIVVYFRDKEILEEVRIQQIGQELLEMLSRVSAQNLNKMLLSFEGVEFMSSGMIGKLSLLHEKAKQHTIDLKVCRISPNLMQLFRLLNLNKAFCIEANEKRAMKSFARTG